MEAVDMLCVSQTPDVSVLLLEVALTVSDADLIPELLMIMA